MKRELKKQPDYPKMIDQILAGGVSQAELGTGIGVVMSDRMLRAYRNGIQPLPNRAAAIERLWLTTTGKKRIPLKAAS